MSPKSPGSDGPVNHARITTKMARRLVGLVIDRADGFSWRLELMRDSTKLAGLHLGATAVIGAAGADAAEAMSLLEMSSLAGLSPDQILAKFSELVSELRRQRDGGGAAS